MGRRGACGCRRPTRRSSSASASAAASPARRAPPTPDGRRRRDGRSRPRVGRNATRGVVVDRAHRAQRPRERLLDVGIGVADQVGRGSAAPAPRPRARDRRVDRRAGSSRSSSRPGGAPSVTASTRAAPARPSGTAPRGCRVPATWASESTVIQSPARGRLRAEPLPRALGLVGDRPLEQVVREPVDLEHLVPEQGVGDVEDGGRPIVSHRRPKPAADRGQQRLPDAERGTEARRDPVHALVVLGIGQALEAGVDGRRERRGLVDQLARLPSRARARRACAPRRARGRAASPVTRTRARPPPRVTCASTSSGVPRACAASRAGSGSSRKA